MTIMVCAVDVLLGAVMVMRKTCRDLTYKERTCYAQTSFGSKQEDIYLLFTAWLPSPPFLSTWHIRVCKGHERRERPLPCGVGPVELG